MSAAHEGSEADAVYITPGSPADATGRLSLFQKLVASLYSAVDPILRPTSGKPRIHSISAPVVGEPEDTVFEPGVTAKQCMCCMFDCIVCSLNRERYTTMNKKYVHLCQVLFAS